MRIEWSFILGLGCPTLVSAFTQTLTLGCSVFLFNLTGMVYESVKAHLEEESCAGIGV